MMTGVGTAASGTMKTASMLLPSDREGTRRITRVVGPLARSAVVLPTSAEPCSVKACHGRAVRGLEGQVGTPGAGGAGAHESSSAKKWSPPSPEISWPRARDSAIEALAPLEICNHEMDVVDQPAAMELHFLISGSRATERNLPGLRSAAI